MTDSAQRRHARRAPRVGLHRACRAPCASSAPACSARASATRSPRSASTSPSTTRPRRSCASRRLRRRSRRRARTTSPSLIVVAVPPDVTADVIERELARYPRAVVTDVASVKLEPLQRAPRTRRRPHALHRLASARRARARRSDLGARRHLRRAPLGGLPRRGDLRRRPRTRRRRSRSTSARRRSR